MLTKRICELYGHRSVDQQALMHNSQHITRIINATRKLGRLDYLCITDRNLHFSETKILDLVAPDELKIPRDIVHRLRLVISPCAWASDYESHVHMNPPVEMLGELCSELGRSGVRPTSVRVDIHPPRKLALLELTTKQQFNIKILVSRTVEVNVQVRCWRKPVQHLAVLGRLTKTLFSAPNAQTVNLGLRDFPVCTEFSTFTLRDLWPIDQTWPKLRQIDLYDVPFSSTELRTVVEQHKRSVNYIYMTGNLVRGTWEDVLDSLRGFEALERISLRKAYVPGPSERFSYWEYEDYIMGKTDQNLLRGQA